MSVRERTGARELNVDDDFVRLIVAKARAAMFEVPDAEADEIEREIEIDAATMQEALEKFPTVAQQALEETLEEMQRMRREQQGGGIIAPGQGGYGGGQGGGMPGQGGGGRIQF